MFDKTTSETCPTVNVSLEAIAAAAEAFGRLDAAFREIETTRRRPGRSGPAPRHSPLELPDRQLAIVEPGAPLVTVYLAAEEEASSLENNTPAPLCELANFWRIWRPPLEFLDRRDRAWLRECDRLDDQIAPPVPARHVDAEGWQDPSPADLDPLARRLRWTADALRAEAAA